MLAVAQSADDFSVSSLIHSGNIETLDRTLDFDERMSRIVLAVRVGFTVRAEVSVMTDDTLVAISHNRPLKVLRLLGTFAIAKDASVLDVRNEGSGNRLVDGSESVAVVFANGFGLETATAVVKVWADKALVADTVNILVATVANRVVTNIATSWEQ